MANQLPIESSEGDGRNVEAGEEVVEKTMPGAPSADPRAGLAKVGSEPVDAPVVPTKVAPNPKMHG